MSNNKYNLFYILSHPEIDTFLEKFTNTSLTYKDVEINTKSKASIPRKDPNNIQRIDEEICDFIYHFLSEIITPIKNFLTANKSNLDILMGINQFIKGIFDNAAWLLWFGIGTCLLYTSDAADE